MVGGLGGVGRRGDRGGGLLVRYACGGFGLWVERVAGLVLVALVLLRGGWACAGGGAV